MDLSAIVINSVKYPFRNISRLIVISVLFVLIAIIPIGKLIGNDFVVLIGVIAFFIFIMIVPGYFLGVVKTGFRHSSAVPSFNLVNSIADSVRVLILRTVYMIIPVFVFFALMSTAGPASIDLIYKLQIPSFLATFGLMILVIVITYLIFEFLLFFAKARMAYLNSLSEALKIHKVVGDIRNIGIGNIIKWAIVMLILVIAVSVISSWVMVIPYVGFLIDLCVVVPIMESIGNYSLGMLYSNIDEKRMIN